MSPTEIMGYLAMATLMISFLLKDITKLRLVNSLACGFFVIYGVMLEPASYPIIISNGFIICVNVYYLSKGLKN
ncbi:MAG: hypothetical protein ACI8V8_001605 [Chitinophagales bacterium]|jgi:hypothetical protein